MFISACTSSTLATAQAPPFPPVPHLVKGPSKVLEHQLLVFQPHAQQLVQEAMGRQGGQAPGLVWLGMGLVLRGCMGV